MIREYNKDFEGKCCEDKFGTCDWTCAEIATRISSRASKGTVYSRGQIDTMVQTLQAQVTTALSNNRIIIDSIDNRPAASSGNAGFMFVTNDFIPNDSSYNTNEDFALDQVIQQVFVSDGTQWIEIVDRAAFTALNPLKGDMEKSVYDKDNSGLIDIDSGGTGTNLSNGEGLLVVNNGAINNTLNYLSTFSTSSGTSDIQLESNSKSVQILNPGTNINLFLPVSPLPDNYFRIINRSQNNSITVRVSIAGDTIVVLGLDNFSAADFHYDNAANQWIAIKLEII